MGATCSNPPPRGSDNINHYLNSTSKPYKDASIASTANRITEEHRRRAVNQRTSDVLLLGAYCLLIPGIYGIHLEYSVLIHDSADSQPVVLVQAQTGVFLLIKMMWEASGLYRALSCFITLWGVMLPFAKLVALLAYRTEVLRSYAAVNLLQGFTKWTIVDSFIPMIWAALFSQPSDVANSTVVVNLHYGWYCFVAHCMLSIAGTVYMEDRNNPDVEYLPTTVHEHPKALADRQAEEMYRTEAQQIRANHPTYGGANAAVQPDRPPFPIGRYLAMACVMLGYFVALCTPIVEFRSASLALDEELSVVTLIASLAAVNLFVAAVVVGLFVAVLPAVDLMLLFSRDATTSSKADVTGASQALFSFCMAEVFIVALAICTQAHVIFGAAVQVELTSAGWAIGLAVVLWSLARQFWLLWQQPRRLIAL